MRSRRKRGEVSVPKIDEVVSRLQESGLGASEEQLVPSGSGAGASRSGAGTLEEKFFKAIVEYSEVLQKMAVIAPLSEQNFDQTAFAKMRESVSKTVTSPKRRESILKMVAELEFDIPSVGEWTLQPSDTLTLLRNAFPEWKNNELINLVGLLKSVGNSSTSTRTSSSTSGFLSFTERGVHALQSRIDSNLPAPLDDVKAQKIWPSKYWITNESPGLSMKTMLKSLPAETNCTFELQDKSSVESVCGKGSKPDVLLVLKGGHADVYTTGAIICLHSKGGNSRFDNAASVGEAIHYGLRFLRKAGTVRDYICVGITDLKEIMWFRVSRDLDGLNEYCTHTPTTGKVKQSLCAYLVAKPASLGLVVGPIELSLPLNWQWKKILGYGRTSTVHEIEIQGGSYAVKIPNADTCLVKDFVYLSRLKGVDGIPTLYAQVGDMLVLQPVGHPFSVSSLKKFQLMQSLPQLVEILKAAHDLGYVNRDIRVENFMIAKSLQGYRLFILDWGFAAECGAECQFAGCLYTSSNNVLSQLLTNDSHTVTYRGADDLVAVVRCMRIFVDSRVANGVLSNFKNSKGRAQVESLMNCWELQAADLVWQEVECKAQNGDYDGVKDFLRVLGSFLACERFS